MNSLTTRTGPHGPDVPFVPMTTDRPFQWLPDLTLFLRRRWRIIAMSVAAAIVLGIAYLLVATPQYSATSELLIDTQAAALLQNQPQLNDSQFINALVESQLEVVQSEGVARDVVRALHLAEDPAFLANGHSIRHDAIQWVKNLFAGSGPALTAGQRETMATELLQQMTTVRRSGISYIIYVSVRSRDPAMSAKLANAIASAYSQAGLNAKSDATRKAGVWMDDRLRELRSQAMSADQAVQTFKAKHNIVDTDMGLMNEHELSQLSQQLVLAHANTASTQARYEQIESIRKNGNYTGSVMDALQDEVITKLREQYTNDDRLREMWAKKYGPHHQAVQNMQQQMDSIKQSIQEELQRIASSYRSAYESALAGEQAIQRKLAQLTHASAGTNQNLVTMRALQSQADTYRTMYSNFLQRYTQAMQDESFPVSQSRVVTAAVPPLKNSSPNTKLVLIGACVIGMGLGFVLAIFRDTMDRGVRTGIQLRSTIGVDCIGMVPVIAKADKPALARPRDLSRHAEARSLITWPAVLRHAALDPMSPCAEVMRRARLRIAQLGREKGEAKVIGCVSVRPGEGKSTISANLAESLARSGMRTLLIDWDLRKLTLTTALSAGRPGGFIDMVTHAGQSLSGLLWVDPVSQLNFLPGGQGTGASLACPADVLNMPSTAALIEVLRQRYDMIVVDLPAMDAAADADAAAALVDGLMLVVEWGRTDADAIAECLANTQAIAPRLIGSILNKVDLRALPRYTDYGIASTGYGRGPYTAGAPAE